jgi:TolA-binding protein
MRTLLMLLTLPLAAAPTDAQQPPPPARRPDRIAVETIERARADAERLRQVQVEEALVSRTMREQLLREELLIAGIQGRLLGTADEALVSTHFRGQLERELLQSELHALTDEAQALHRLSETMAVTDFHSLGGSAGGLASLRTQQGTPEDSLYRLARETLNRGEYTRAAQLFQTFQERFPNARTAPAALYWRAFALYRAGGTSELRSALAALQAQRTRYPNTAQDADAAALQTRIHAALARRGDQQAAAALRAANAQGGTATCDREDMEIRTEALNALARQDEAAAGQVLGRVLAQRDECSATLRRRAVYLLGRRTDPDVATRLLEVARNDPDRNVRNDAIAILGRIPGEQTIRHLEAVFTGATDERTQAAVFTALRNHNTPAARGLLRRFVERTDLSDGLRVSAVNAMTGGSRFSYVTSRSAPTAVSISGGRVSTTTAPTPVAVPSRQPPATVRIEGQAVEAARAPFIVGSVSRTGSIGGMGGASAAELTEEDAAFLRGVYARETSRPVKEAIIHGLARAGGSANDQWLMGIVRNTGEENRYRSAALSRMRAERFPIEEVSRLYDAVTDRQLRSALIGVLAQREEDAATDKLADIIRNGTDPQIRREAMSALTRKKDPRSTRILLELIER